MPKSIKGEETKRRIFEAAKELFLLNGYHKTSILSIAKKAKTSPAAFYQYFSDKNSVFEIILEAFISNFILTIEDTLSTNFALEKKLRFFLKKSFERLWDSRGEFKVFREAEFIDLNLAMLFELSICESLEKSHFSFGRKFDQKTIFWFLLGPLFYIGSYWILLRSEPVPEEIIDDLIFFYLNGISSEIFHVDEKVFKQLPLYYGNFEENEKRGKKTKIRLMESAELLFGTKGYYSTTVWEISSKSDVSIGTFYIYFESKKDILNNLSMETSKSFRHFLSINIKDYEDIRNQEIAGFNAFLTYFQIHSNMYGIIREAEFIDPKISLNYYDSVRQSYYKALELAEKKNQIFSNNLISLSFILMGLGHYMGNSLLILQKKKSEDFEIYLKPISDLIINGINKTCSGG